MDLDAHQGNGTARCSALVPDLLLFDVFNSDIYPRDKAALDLTWRPLPVPMRTRTEKYLETIYQELPSALEKARPGIVFYNAGTDIFIKDPLGSNGLA